MLYCIIQRRVWKLLPAGTRRDQFLLLLLKSMNLLISFVLVAFWTDTCSGHLLSSSLSWLVLMLLSWRPQWWTSTLAPSAVCVHRCGLVEMAALGHGHRLVLLSGLLCPRWGHFHHSSSRDSYENMVDLEDFPNLEFPFPHFHEVAQLWGSISYWKFMACEVWEIKGMEEEIQNS